MNLSIKTIAKKVFAGITIFATVLSFNAPLVVLAKGHGHEGGGPSVEKVELCHKTGTTWQYMDTPAGPSLDGHLGHGDFLYTGGSEVLDKDAWCVNNAPPVDLCPNIDGVQATIPDGKEIVNGSCVDIVIPSVTISAKKVVCDTEAQLPNWGAGGQMITATTADDWVAQSEGSCRIDPTWEFQWGDQNALDGGSATVGPVSGYTTFTGTTTVSLSGISEFRLREVLKEGYIPFTGQNTDQNVSAEFYCHNDALNYDNWDFIRNPQAGQTYHCVGFNAPVVQESQQCSIVSDTTNLVEGTVSAVPTWTHSSWVNSTLLGSVAKWIWDSFKVINPTTDETKVFTKQFSVTGPVSAATLDIAADNGYIVKLNGDTVVDKLAIETNYSALSTYDVASYLDEGINTIEITVKNFAMSNGTDETNPAGLLYKLAVTAKACSDNVPPPPQKATVTMCKVDEQQNPLSGWTLMLKQDKVQDLTVPTNVSTGIDSDPLVAGMSYIAQVAGTWLNQGGANPVDAEYSTTTSDWSSNVMDGYTGYSSDILELQIDQSFDPNSTWGPYNSLHTYARSFVPVTSSANFRIFDGSGTTQNESWFGDNSGSLSVSLFPGYAGITGENGCVSFENVPFGTYTLDEIQKAGWEVVSGLGAVTIDSQQESFTVVNRDTSVPVEQKGSIEITKYACPISTTVLRSVNGVDGVVPEGCVPEQGKTFGYVYGTKTDANAPYPELAGPYIAGGATNSSGVLLISNLSATGRYLISETNELNQKLPDADILGLYCEGDGDTSATNDNQELTFVPANGVAKCVAYNKLAPSSQEPQDTEGDTNPPVVPTTPSGGSTARGGGAPILLSSAPQGQVLGASTTCGLYLTSYLKRGWKNNREEVKKLQTFLNDYLSLSPAIPVTGVFGPRTYAAVLQFQQMESGPVLQPWVGVTLKSANKGTGFVYKTTQTRINNIMCPDLNLPIPKAVID